MSDMRSKPTSVFCPKCSAGSLRNRGPSKPWRCDSCGYEASLVREEDLDFGPPSRFPPGGAI
jgi:uncharacterized protein (DUF983 family)